MTISARARITAVLFALGFALSLSLARVVPFNARTFLFDYHAFACAGAVAGTRDDPYRAEPLRSCEHRRIAFRADQANLAVPAPLPGYALAPFSLLGRLPVPLGAALWLAFSLVGALIAGFALVRLSRLEAPIVWAVLALPLLAPVVLGQLVPVALGALCLCALALERGKYALAAACAWIAMIEPHVALPACLALAIFVPRTRMALGIGAAVAALLVFALLGIGVDLEYLASVLGAHAASELTNEEQYGIAYYLHAIGAGDRAALLLADAWYVLMAALGTIAAHRLVLRGAPRALYALLPAALAVVGAPFLHIAQVAFALPAALVLCGRVWPSARAPRLALAALALPWGAFPALVAAAPLAAVAFGSVVSGALRARPLAATIAGLAAGSFIFELSLHLTARPDAAAALSGFRNGRLLAEASWGAYIQNGFHSNVALFMTAKVPTYLGLGLLLWLSARAVLARTLPGSAAPRSGR